MKVIFATLPVVLALAACSGASVPSVDLAPPAGATSLAPDPSTTDDAGASASSSGSGSDDGTGNGNGNGSSSGSSSGGSSIPGGNAPAPSQCPANGTTQASGTGDSQADATPFGTVACGSVSAGSTDWWQFELPASTSKFGFQFTGGLDISLTVDGATFQVQPGTVLPFHKKTPYYVSVTPAGGTSESYVLVVNEQ
jgi:hypothetical protein